MLINSLILMIVALVISAGAFWLFFQRGNHSKWAYAAYGLGFGFLAFGVYPATTWMAFAGITTIIITSGLQVISNILLEGEWIKRINDTVSSQ